MILVVDFLPCYHAAQLIIPSMINQMLYILKKLVRQIATKPVWIGQQLETYPLRSVVILFLVTVVAWLIWGTYQAKNTGFENKSLWDWMELLLVPGILAGGLWALNESARRAEREISVDKQYQANLESYIERIASLLLEKNLRSSKKDDEVRIIAQTLTLIVLANLDGNRKGIVVKFLYESGLIKTTGLIDLHHADLRDVQLSGYNLSDINLSGAYLTRAQFYETNLVRADLSGAQLGRSNLTKANLDKANLTCAFLVEADLQKASLREANVVHTYFVGSDLSYSDLSGANLFISKLNETEQEKARAFISTQTGYSMQDKDIEDDLEQSLDPKAAYIQFESARSLKKAIMPDGTQFLGN